MTRLIGLSSLQKKGITVLSLLLIAETVTFSNAVRLWSTYESFLDESGRRTGDRGSSKYFKFQNDNGNLFSSKQQDCVNSPGGFLTAKTSCSSSPRSIKSKLLSPLVRLTENVQERLAPEDCCKRCAKCMEPSQAMDQCGILRGGHSAAHHVAEKMADTVAQGTDVAPYGIPLHLWKIIFQAILTTINVACWLLPLRSKKMSENKLGLSLANAFSGGVFLSLAFAHLIPECVHGFHDYPEVVPYMLVLAGYLLIFFVEKVAFDSHSILHEMEHAGEHKHDHGRKENGGKDFQESGSRGAVILLAALAIHSILEMMALGLADTFGDCSLLTLSIALHQPAESIALLVAFLKSGMPKGQIIQYLSVFSAMGPIGVALGIAVNEFAAPIVDAIFIAIVAGTFVYVGATEVVPEEWEEPEHKWKKFAALMSGIISIFAITQYTATLGAH